jgi:uncharacterized protein YmfQ (DUF2313 family)
MSLTAEQYRDQLMALAPTGQALPTDTDSVWARLLLALAGELARLDGRADDLVDEADPRTALEMLADWERVCGLPGACSQDIETIQDRRRACHMALAAQGGQSALYYIDMAAALGVVVTVKEFRPFRAGAAVAGDPLTNGDWIYAWSVRAPATTVQYFQAGGNAAGDALANWGNEALECRLSRLAPAHTILIFVYGEE